MHQNWKFHHVATIVRDINQAIEHYRTLEIGAFPPFIELEGITPLVEKATYGQPSDYSIDMRHAEGSVGDLCFELIELLTGDTPARDFLEKKGEGIHHIGRGRHQPGNRQAGRERLQDYLERSNPRCPLDLL
ncbi:MAG: VOC family protein [Dehalococcoidales bacterium]|jgi:hypothetical protein|nr:VOC family protein [Dehalococcoidales bacterium]MDP7415460.1 VOC family protein [Dehalococcoidales bacterium]